MSTLEGRSASALLLKWLPYILIAVVVLAGLALISRGSEVLGSLLAWVGNLLGFGGKAVVGKVRKRAKIKADKIASGGPNAVIDDIIGRID